MDIDNLQSIEQVIKHVDLFRGLMADEVRKIFARGMTMRCVKGEILFKKGTTGNQMYILLGGKMGVFDGQKLIATLKTGDMFGEMALVNNEPRSATVVAMEDSRVFILTQTTFDKLLSKRVAVTILLNIIRTLSVRLKESNKKFSGS